MPCPGQSRHCSILHVIRPVSRRCPPLLLPGACPGHVRLADLEYCSHNGHHTLVKHKEVYLAEQGQKGRGCSKQARGATVVSTILPVGVLLCAHQWNFSALYMAARTSKSTPTPSTSSMASTLASTLASTPHTCRCRNLSCV